MQKISPFLCFNDDAEQAVNFYVSLFRNAKIVTEHRRPPSADDKKGAFMSATFELEGLRFMAMNAGPHFKFSPAISLFVSCESQSEVDELWAKLGEGGQEQRCGWVKDRFGISWQLIPNALGRLLSSGDPAAAQRVMKAMFPMNKIDIAALERAHAGTEAGSS